MGDIDRALPRPFLRYARLWPLARWVLFGIGLLVVIGAVTSTIPYGGGMIMEDGRNYWEGLAYSDVHYRYSPAFLWVTAPLRALSFEAFTVAWIALHLAAVVWLGPWLLAFPPVADDIIAGNINTFLAVGVVLALKGHPWTWAAPLLTKVTPGVGILYHLGRREWRAALLGLGVTAAIVAVGFAFDPDLWMAWIDSLRAGPANYRTIDVLAPLPIRVAVGAGLCVLSARWVWLLPIGMIVAMPGLWPSSFALLAAIPLLIAKSPVSPHMEPRQPRDVTRNGRVPEVRRGR